MSRPTTHDHRNPIISEMIEKSGGVRVVCETLGPLSKTGRLSKQAVAQWTEIPNINYLLPLSALSGIPIERLLPPRSVELAHRLRRRERREMARAS